MVVRRHAISSVPLGLGYYLITKDIATTLIAMVMTIIIDLDHVLDFIVIHKKMTSIKKMADKYKTHIDIQKFYIIFHSWELVILSTIYLLYKPDPYLIAVLIGYIYHLFLDQIYHLFFLGKYNIKILFYFFIYRAVYNFDNLSLRRESKKIKE